MILVTLGTQKQQFTRLLDYIEKSNIKDEIIVQAGHTKYKSKKMKIFDFIDYDTMEKYVDEADLIITHGGTGSITGPLKKGKKIIACARKKEYNEHVDNHQEELVNVFNEEGYILKLDDKISLDDLFKKIGKFKPKKFISNTEKFTKKIDETINGSTKNEYSSIILLIMFIAFVFMAIVLLLFREQKVFSANENRNLNKIDIKQISELDGGVFQEELENALADQIVLSQTLKIYGKKLSLFISNLNLNMLYDYDGYDIVPASNGLYWIKDTDYLVYGETSIELLKRGLMRRIENAIDIAQKYPNVKVYAWLVRRELDFKNSSEYDAFIKGESGDLVTYSSFSKVNSYEDYMKYFYKSDHHWNYIGQYEAYKEIANMLDFDENEYVKIIGEDCFGNIKFNGSKAREIGNINLNDIFCTYKYDLPDYTTKVPNSNVNINLKRRLYYERKIPEISDLNHYGSFYGGDYGEIRYTFESNIGKENILIFADSYSNPINELIASHYYKTFVIDLRNYESLIGEKFVLSEYIADKKIDNLMFLGNINLFSMDDFDVEIGG